MHSDTESASKRVKLSILARSKGIDVPQDWLVKQLKQIAKVNPEAIDESYPYKEILYVDIGSIENFRVKRYEQISLDQRPSRAQRIIRKNDIIVSTVRPNLKAFAKIDRHDSNLVCSTGFAVIRPIYPEDVDFIFNFVKSHHFETNIMHHMEGVAYPAITSKVVERCLIPYPPTILERIKIGLILSTADNVIQNTEQIIGQTQRLKKGLMQSLLTRGINHTKFKTVNIGKKFLNVTIPESWSVKKFGDVLKVRKIFIDLDDSADYTRVTVRFNHEGVVVRDIVKGKDILTKNQYRVYGGDFIISRRKIVFKSCGLVPEELDGAIVSNEYSCFTGTEYLNLNYMDWFSRTKLFHQTIRATTQGTVDKYFFLLEEWLKLLIPLPPIEEQREIVNILSRVENLLGKHQDYLQDLNMVKKGLMQKLLTGKIRVKV